MIGRHIEAFASGADKTDAIAQLRGKVFHKIKWHDLMAAHEENAEQAAVCLNALYDGAGNYISAGLFASDAVGFKSPFEKAQFSFIRNAFFKEWQPRGGIEASLVDTLAQCYVAWQYWLTQSFEVANTQDTVIEQRAKNKKSERSRYDEGDWQPPRVTAIEDLDHCTQMADRFNRMFLRILRQMRDLRRYAAPVTINNPRQVNIAADGGQQNNVQKGVTRKKKSSKGARATVRAQLKIAAKD